jgi:hypothetical protein
MRRGLLHITGWTLATGAMIGLSWYGVHSVLVSSVVGQPRSLPAAGSLPVDDSQPRPAAPGTPSAPSASPSAGRPTPSASLTPAAHETTAQTRTGHQQGDGPGRGRPGWPTTGGTGTRTYTVDGGRVVLDLGPSSATLVSATPDAGWSMRDWQQSGWIRVDFTSGNRTSSVVCSWNGHPPVVQTLNS